MTLSAALPAGFVWGAATAAYQIEGGKELDGRTPSIWDTYSHTPGMVANGDTGDDACDSYRRWPEDLELLKRLGVDAYRFSTAWPRVVPDASGQANPLAIAHYSRMVDDLLEAGITPLITLYHWDLPQYVQDAGGWPSRDTADKFADYAGIMARALGDRVTDWVTVNEPLCVAWIGHLDGRMAPGDTDIAIAVPASYHVLLGHGLAMAALRAESSQPASVGIVLNLSPIEPATDSPADAAATAIKDGHINRWFLDPVFGRGFPADVVKHHGVELPMQDGDLDIMSAPMDFLGINYYFREVVAADPSDPVLGARQVPVPGARTTAMGWEVHPDGLEQILVRVAREYQPPVIYVTESGCAVDDTVEADGSINDADRTEYLESHLAACARAVEQGVPLKGYYAWSLLDNFEWAYGYEKRFGLVRVDYDTYERTIKASGRRYADIITEHRAATAAR
ncbi:MAG: GH1 family beta-glucosidase [Mycobacteriales bacterium]